MRKETPMDTYTNTSPSPDTPGLTLEHLLEAHRRLIDWLPEVLYHSSDLAPLTNAQGEPIYLWIDRREYLEQFGMPEGATVLVFVHPDNLPKLRAACAGLYRLVPLRKDTPNL
jgi:hypothetical protein